MLVSCTFLDDLKSHIAPCTRSLCVRLHPLAAGSRRFSASPYTQDIFGGWSVPVWIQLVAPDHPQPRSPHALAELKPAVPVIGPQPVLPAEGLVRGTRY